MYFQRQLVKLKMVYVEENSEGRGFVVRERMAFSFTEEEVKTLGNSPFHSSVPTGGTRYETGPALNWGNMVIKGVHFWVQKGKLKGGVIMPSGRKNEGMKVEGKFLVKTNGSDFPLELSSDFVSQVLSKNDLDEFELKKADTNNLRKYVTTICDYSIEDILSNESVSSKKDEYNNIVSFITFLLEVELSVMKDEITKPQRRQDNFVREITNLFGDEKTADIVVECQGAEFHCHRAILMARSSTFAGGLSNNFSEGSKGRWTVKEARPETVKDILCYIYTNKIPECKGTNSPIELLQLASQYQLEVGDCG